MTRKRRRCDVMKVGHVVGVESSSSSDDDYFYYDEDDDDDGDDDDDFRDYVGMPEVISEIQRVLKPTYYEHQQLSITIQDC